jgi:hypothetical protein
MKTKEQNKRTPKSNSEFLKKWYKSSTLGRLKVDLKYKNNRNIDNCKYITEWLDLCFYNHPFNGYIQDELFNWIRICQELDETIKMRKEMIIKMMDRK